MRTADVTTGELAAALGYKSAGTVRAKARQRRAQFLGFTETDGGHYRWTPARAAEIVVAFGREVPETWKERAK